MEQRSNAFIELASEAIAEPEKAIYRSALGAAMPPLRNTAVAQFGGDEAFDALRRNVRERRRHSTAHLGYYLEQFVARARENGNTVHFARSASELNDHVLAICHAAKVQRVIKGKSMVTEETGLNQALADAGLNVRETDLGEYIIQEAGETPSHIVGPALHKTPDDIRQLFFERHDLGDRDLDRPEDMVAEARAVLRQEFLAADAGIIGSNGLIASTGHTMLVTNEGNGDLCVNLPRVLIICTTIDRVFPRPEDAMAMLRLLVRSTTGQPVTSYTSFYQGPRRGDDEDGPLETHLVLLDNGRSELLQGPYEEMLQCLRCGACLNHCPVYMNAGGHAYGWVYPGPMGSVLTPLLTSLETSAPLPDACTGCGRCAEVCPALIPLPDLIRDLRAEKHARGVTARRWRLGMALHAWLARHPRLYQHTTAIGIWLLRRMAGRRGVLKRLPLAGGWLKSRDLPVPPESSFLASHRERLS